ncbi:MAG TPA: sigma-70 family RNA polymerase sigma factor [Pseudonocardiaceae bacterium]|nr:sigma-70 family RNA polymerase sigma factor [Pseudonocardiaceae bacterium]
MTDTTDVLRDATDAELLRLVRAGHEAAFGELFVRHASAVRGYALRCCADVAEAEDLAAEAFFRVFQAVRRGSGPADNMRAYLLTVVRRLAAEWTRRDVPISDDELGRQVDASGATTPTSGADLQLIARAFTSLPRRWRAVLWRVEVEGERPAVVARHFGLSANATAALARRARRGLRAAYLQAHLSPTGGANGCRTVVAKLGGFTAGQVSGVEADRIEQHLAGCASCRALHAELVDVCAGLRRYAGSLAPGAALGHAALGKAGLIGHIAVTSARLKLAVAAVSAVAVGGFGIAAGPVLHRLDPSPNHGMAVGPALLSTAPVTDTRASRATGLMQGRIAAAFHPATRHHATPTGRATHPIAPTTQATAPGTTGSSTTRTTPPSPPSPTTTSAEPRLQRAAATPVTTTVDAAPMMTPQATAAPMTTWSTSWTNGDTTVWLWGWSGRP